MSRAGIGIGIGEGLEEIAKSIQQRRMLKEYHRDKEADRLEKQLQQIAANKVQLKQELAMTPQGTPDYVSKAGELQNIDDILAKSTQDYHALGADDQGWLIGRIKGLFHKEPLTTPPFVGGERYRPGITQTAELLSAASPLPDIKESDAYKRRQGALNTELGVADLKAKAPVQQDINLSNAKSMAKFQKDLQDELDAAADKYAEENGLSDEQKKNLKAMHAGIPPALLVRQQVENDTVPLGEPYAVNGKTFQRFRSKDGTVTEKEIPGPAKTENFGPEERAMNAWLAKPENKGKTEDDFLRWKQGLSASAEDSSMTLSNDALDIAARRYLQDGTLPPMGMGKQSTKQRENILNRAAQIDPDANIAGNVATYASQKSALSQIEKTISAVESFESTALKNLDQFIKTARKVVDSGSPWVNQVIRTVSKSGLGSADTAAYDAARQVAMTEIARVVSNPNLTGVLSDSARHEMDIVLSGNATLKQIVSAAEILKADMKNRSGSLKTQRETIKKDLSQTPGDLKAKASPTAGGPDAFTLPDGTVVKRQPDGTYK